MQTGEVRWNQRTFVVVLTSESEPYEARWRGMVANGITVQQACRRLDNLINETLADDE